MGNCPTAAATQPPSAIAQTDQHMPANVPEDLAQAQSSCASVLCRCTRPVSVVQTCAKKIPQVIIGTIRNIAVSMDRIANLSAHMNMLSQPTRPHHNKKLGPTAVIQ